MASIETADFPNIIPAIIEFDELNDTLRYVSVMAEEAKEHNKKRFDDDKAEQYFGAVKLLRSNEGKPLREFMKHCGKIALSDEIEFDKELETAVGLIVVGEIDEDARDQAEVVMRRFSAKPHTNAYDTLYGNVYARNSKKPATKKSRNNKPAPVVAVVSNENTEIVTEAKPKPNVIVSTRLQRERQLSGSEVVDAGAFAEKLADKVNEFMESHGGTIKANRIYRFIEVGLGLDGDRDAARAAISNLLFSGKTHNAGTSDGMLYLSTQPDVKIAAKSPNSRSDQQEEELEMSEDLLKHELVPDILKQIFLRRHQDVGCSVRNIAISLGADEADVRRVANYLANKGILNRKPSNKSKTVAYQFPDQKAWEKYKNDPKQYIESLEQD